MKSGGDNKTCVESLMINCRVLIITTDYPNEFCIVSERFYLPNWGLSGCVWGVLIIDVMAELEMAERSNSSAPVATKASLSLQLCLNPPI